MPATSVLVNESIDQKQPPTASAASPLSTTCAPSEIESQCSGYDGYQDRCQEETVFSPQPKGLNTQDGKEKISGLNC